MDQTKNIKGADGFYYHLPWFLNRLCLRARYDFLVKICDDRRETDASCLVGLLQGPRDSFPYSAIILKVASLLVISDLLEQQIIGSSSCSRCFYLVKNTTISGVCQCLSWGEKPQKNRAWKAAAKGLKKLCWVWIFPPVSAEYCMMFYDATGLWKKSWIFCGLQLAFYWQPTLIYIFVERLPISFWESQDCYSVCWNMRRAAANFLFSDSPLRYELHLMIPFSSDAMCIFSSRKKRFQMELWTKS